jgi:glycine cleavage system H protein
LKIENCDFPDALLYDVDSATWAKEAPGGYTIGVTPLLPWLSGGFTSVSFKPEGFEAKTGQGLASVEGPRHFDLVRAPFDCVVAKVNSRLLTAPALASKDPYGEGWVVTVSRAGGDSKLRPLSDAASQLKETIGRLGVKCFSMFPDLEMVEIGTECSAVISKLNEVIGGSRTGTVVHLVSDDPTSDIELARWEDTTGNRIVESRREGALHHYILKKA